MKSVYYCVYLLIYNLSLYLLALVCSIFLALAACMLFTVALFTSPPTTSWLSAAVLPCSPVLSVQRAFFAHMSMAWR